MQVPATPARVTARSEPPESVVRPASTTDDRSSPSPYCRRDVTADHSLVDPRAPRFGQAATATLAAVAVVLGDPLPVAVLALVLGGAVVSRWRVDAWAALWRHVVAPLVDPPTEREPAAPHRFAKLVGAAFAAVATPLVLVGGPLAVVGYALVATVVVLAALGAATGFCLGCRLYEQVGVFRRAGVL